MIVVCPACQARFQYDDSRFGEARMKRFKCPKCSHVFEVANPAVAAPPPEEILSRPLSSLLPEPEPTPAPLAHALTTARRDRDAMLVAAGIQEAGLPAGYRFSLAFLSGPQASTVQVLNRPQIVIGREEGDIITQDPETSRRHARLEIHWDGSVWLTDLQSTNGTFVDGAQITTTVRLMDRQEFSCGKSTFMLLVRKEDSGME